MAALVIKVGALLLKQLAKPLSSRFQTYVMSHPVARQQAITASQYMHRMEVWITRAADGKTGRAFVGDMTEEKSIELASKLVSEGFVFAVGLAIVAFEFERQRQKEIKNKAKEAAERQAILDRAREEQERLARENRDQTELIQTLMTRVDSLENNLQRLHEEAMRARNQPKGMWGGFLGPRAKPAAAAATAGAA